MSGRRADASLPAPPWAAEINLGCFEAVELPVRMIGGPLFAGLSDTAARAMLQLLAFAWHEVPAGSVPDHAPTLARAAGLAGGVSAWQAVAAEVLGGWTLCDDGRFYLTDWADVIESAWGRRRKTSSAAVMRQRRKSVRDLLAEVGVPNVDRLPVAKIDDFAGTFYGRGGADWKGRQRRDAAAVIAAEFGLMRKVFPIDGGN